MASYPRAEKNLGGITAMRDAAPRTGDSCMNADSSRNRFAAWEETVAEAVAFAEQYAPEVRSGIVQALLHSSADPATGDHQGARTPVTEEVRPDQSDASIGAVAKSAGVSVSALQRFIQIADDGAVTIRARLGKNTKADRQNAYSAVLAYVREKALDELDTSSALVNATCREHHCHDRNLTNNLKKRGWLLEHGVKGGPKSYRLSPAGEEAARELLVALCPVD